ncbi:MAG: hypothetical protein II231_00595 [Rikenellaceae bacterium]|nr:hypothetical protein [Rikenellaceae bacterium]
MKILIGNVSKKMKKMKKYIMMLAVAATMIACTEDPYGEITPEVPEAPYTTLAAEAGEDISRTTLDGTDGLSIHWDAGDQIYVWGENATTGVAYKTAEGGHRRALFGAATQAPTGNIYSVYPYAEVPVYEYDTEGNVTNTTYVKNIKSVIGTKATLDLGVKVPGTTNTYGQFCEGDINENGVITYTSATRTHYDVLYGSAYYDGYNTVKFKHAFSALRFTIPTDGWYNPNAVATEDYLNAYDALISKNSGAYLDLEYAQIDFAEGTNVCGEMTIDAATGECTATSNSLRIYTYGMTSKEKSAFWGFFYAPKGEVEFKLTVKGTIHINDKISFPVTAYTRTKKATFQNGHVRTVNLSVKDFTVEPVDVNEEKTVNYFVLNDALADLDADKYAFGTYDDAENHTNYGFNDPCESMTGWKFYTAELMNTNTTDGAGWAGESSKVKDYNRIALVRELNNDNRAAFCTPAINLPEGVESATVTVKFDALYNSKDLGTSNVIDVAVVDGDPSGADIVTAADKNVKKSFSLNSGSLGDVNTLTPKTGLTTSFDITSGQKIAFTLDVSGNFLSTAWMEDFGLHRAFIYNLEISYKYTNTIKQDGYIF